MNKTDASARRERALRRLGTRNPICATCGETNPHCLELHHIAGEKHHHDTVISCRNCHRKLSDAQLDHPPQISIAVPSNSNIGHYLLGLADLFRMIADALAQFGRWLIDQAKADAGATS